jgi:hypothetical protein
LVLTGANPGSTDPVSFVAGNDIVLTADTTGDTSLTIAHESFTTTAADTANGGTLSHGGKFTAITAITADNGHVTGYQPTQFTLPADNNTTYTLDLEGTHKIVLNGSNPDSEDAITLANDDYITLTDDITNQKITVGHKTYTAGTQGSSTTTDATLNHGDSLTAVVGVTRDAGGHLTGVKTRKFTLPGDNNTTYTLSGHATAAKTVTGGTGATITTTLTDSNSGTTTATMDLTSTSLNVVAGTKAVAIDLVWGTF